MKKCCCSEGWKLRFLNCTTLRLSLCNLYSALADIIPNNISVCLLSHIRPQHTARFNCTAVNHHLARKQLNEGVLFGVTHQSFGCLCLHNNNLSPDVLLRYSWIYPIRREHYWLILFISSGKHIYQKIHSPSLSFSPSLCLSCLFSCALLVSINAHSSTQMHGRSCTHKQHLSLRRYIYDRR